MEFIILEAALINISCFSGEFALALHLVVYKSPFINIAISKCVLADTMKLVLMCLSLILVAISIWKGASALDIANLEVTQVLISVWPDMCSPAVTTILVHLADIFGSAVIEYGFDAWLWNLLWVRKEYATSKSDQDGFPKKIEHYNNAIDINDLESYFLHHDTTFV